MMLTRPLALKPRMFRSARIQPARRVRSYPQLCRAFSGSSNASAPVKLKSTAVESTKPIWPPIVFLHGFLGNGRNWSSIARKLTETHRNRYLLDLRNHGQSPHDANGTLQAQASDVIAFIQNDLGLRQAALVVSFPANGALFTIANFGSGTSLGGRVAMAVAHLRPECVERLVVVDTAPVDYALQANADSYGNVIAEEPKWNHLFGHWRLLTRILSELPLDACKSRGEADAWLKTRILSPTIRAYLLTNLQQSDDGKLSWRLNLPALHSHVEHIARFPFSPSPALATTPALFLRGARSAYVAAPEHQEAVKRFFPNSRIVPLDAGHWVHAERPDDFVREVSQFMRVG